MGHTASLPSVEGNFKLKPELKFNQLNLIVFKYLIYFQNIIKQIKQIK